MYQTNHYPKETTMRSSLDRRQFIQGAGLATLFTSIGVSIPVSSHAAVDAASLPEVKRTRAGLYVEASEVPVFVQARGGFGKILFLDIRTRVEAMYLGMANSVDALVPYVEHQELMTDWDDVRGGYRLEPMQDFVPEVNRRLQSKALTKEAVVLLICRSGDRSSRAANRLMDDGFTQVWSVVDGFEGDMSKEGRRSVNGWKNAGLPWSYKLERTRMYFPR